MTWASAPLPGTFMGGRSTISPTNIRGLSEVPQMFFTLANHKGWGVALQDFPISSAVATIGRRRMASKSRRRFDRRGAAEERKLKWHGPAAYLSDQRIALRSRSW
jgi:hypothetical protein